MSVNPDTIPRYEPPALLAKPEPRRRCGDCRHYAEVAVTRNAGVGVIGRCLDAQVAGQLDELVGVCCLERDDGTYGDAYAAEPDDDPAVVACDWWEPR